MFEARLALSASLAADWLADAWGVAVCYPAVAGNQDQLGPDSGSLQATGTLAPTTMPSQPAPQAAGVGGAEPNSAADSVTPPLQAAELVRQQFSLGGAGQTVAIIDTGIAWDHVAFAKPGDHGASLSGYGPGYRVVGGWDFAAQDDAPYDDGPAGFHGTHVAGILAGQSDGFAGVAPEADIVALRVFDDQGMGRLDWVESALRWVAEHRTAFEHPITTVNLSLGVYGAANSAALTMLDSVLDQLWDDGVMVVGAAGNSFDATRPDHLTYPASHPLVEAVSSIDASGIPSGFSQRADGVLAAPGVGILSSVPDHVNGWSGRVDDFAAASGTSMAAPQVAGAAMLVRQAMESIGQEATPDSVFGHLRDTSRLITDPATGITLHQLDLYTAVESLVSQATDPPAEVPPEPISPDPAPPDPAPPDPAPPESTGLVWLDDETLLVRGSETGNRVTVDLSTSVRITVDSVVHGIDRPLANLVIDGVAGANTLEIIGSDDYDRVVMRAATAPGETAGGELVNTQLTARFESFSSIRFVGQGIGDRVTMFDSPGNDVFEASPERAVLRGTGFTFVAHGVPNVFAHGTAGGVDTAYLYDSPGDDTLAIRHQFTSLRGDGMFRMAYGFERVYAFATAGGYNQATLHDSPGDDTFNASASGAWISSRDYYAGARGFDSITAISSAGGHDVARLHAADDDVRWTRAGNLLKLTDSDGQVRSAQGFATTDAFVAGKPADVIPKDLRQAVFDEERIALRQLFAEL